jgi:hypothetical protein
MSHFQSRWLAPVLLCAGLSSNMYAVDGVVLIDQNRALAGNVTPGDTPGFPVTISVAGSYRLAGNLTVPDTNTTAILVTADNVTIDLNGFSIVGPTVCVGAPLGPVTSCSPTGTGAGVDGGLHSSITVVNGSVRGMGQAGIILRGNGGSVEKVHADSNGSLGIGVTNGTVRGNTANFNGGLGIGAGSPSTMSGNTARFNGMDGIHVDCPSSAVGNAADSNGGQNLSTSPGVCALANNAAP